MARVTKSNPLCSSMTPKENRVFPEMGSSPTEASRSPSAIIMSPLTTEAPERVTAMSRPTTARAELLRGAETQGEPGDHRREQGQSQDADRPGDERTDGGDAEGRAGPPLRAIWYPSMQVTTDAASPGRFRRMEVVEPPYIEP